jgi:putative hydrolase of the HAD superfamily
LATRAVFLDALGTLVELEPPWVLLRERIPERITDDELVRAVRSEMDYYRRHAHEGRDEASLADLRQRCADVINAELGTEVTVDELVESVRMRAYPDAEPALRALAERGQKLVVVSNWDCSLGSVLERCGLGGLLDGAISSAEAGSRKPEPEIFGPALELAGCTAAEALHVGDTSAEDVEGARAAGIRALLIDRHEDGGGESEGAVISSLAEIEEHLADG